MTRLSLESRPRRNRKHPRIRAFCRETHLGPEHFVYPVFVHDSSANEAIASMPGCERLSLPSLLKAAEEAVSLGIGTLVLFPKIDETLKDSRGTESYNEQGLIPRCIRALKAEFPDLLVMSDVALDPYSSDGHDGIVADDGRILNDETVAVLCKQALSQARAGADVIAPSDMMDGRVAAIRRALDEDGHEDVSILSYTAKYASAFYGPFRDALDSAPKAGDKKTYQMDPANVREALREASLDVAEGADILMVKPAGPYLDVLSELRRSTQVPLAAYQVSGEYAMLKAACQAGWLDETKVAYESLLSIRRAGADWILSYYACQVARWIKEGKVGQI